MASNVHNELSCVNVTVRYKRDPVYFRLDIYLLIAHILWFVRSVQYSELHSLVCT